MHFKLVFYMFFCSSLDLEIYAHHRMLAIISGFCMQYKTPYNCSSRALFFHTNENSWCDFFFFFEFKKSITMYGLAWPIIEHKNEYVTYWNDCHVIQFREELLQFTDFKCNGTQNAGTHKYVHTHLLLLLWLWSKLILRTV